MKTLNIMLVCGEPSGDALGAQLMAGLKALAGDRIRFSGVGGLAMAREGLVSLYSLDATAVMGLREVVPAIPKILKRSVFLFIIHSTEISQHQQLQTWQRGKRNVIILPRFPGSMGIVCSDDFNLIPLTDCQRFQHQ